MGRRNDSALFFTCSLIEQLGRMLHAKRGDVVMALGEAGVQIIYDHADVLHCEPIAKVAEDAAERFHLEPGDYDNVSEARYAIPDVWTMGKVYARLVEDVSGDDDMVKMLMEVYTSWIDERLCDYNAAFYYQSRDYLAECYRQGTVLDG